MLLKLNLKQSDYCSSYKFKKIFFYKNSLYNSVNLSTYTCIKVIFSEI